MTDGTTVFIGKAIHNRAGNSKIMCLYKGDCDCTCRPISSCLLEKGESPSASSKTWIICKKAKPVALGQRVRLTDFQLVLESKG